MSDSSERAALYARVSSEQQAEARTIVSQVEALRGRVVDDGLHLESGLEFIDDGYSGATLVRPGLERLRDLAAGAVFDRLYVHSPDRLARKYAYQVLLIDELQRCGVQVVFLNHGVGETAEEKLLLQVQGMVAEYERAKIMERCRRGKLHAGRRGSVNVLSSAPYGYRYVRASEAGEARYEIVAEQAQVVRQIFEWVGWERCTINSVCKRLREKEIPTSTGKLWWDRSVVWAMLKNPAYKGQAAYGKTRCGAKRPQLRPPRGASEQPRAAYSTYSVPAEEWIHIPVPAIVGGELHEMVQEQLEENRSRARQRGRGARHLLQGLVVCKRCGYAFYGKPVSLASAKGKRRHYVYYRCVGSDSHRFGGQRVCSNQQVRSDLLEQAVWEDVCGLLADPQRIEQEYQRRLKAQPPPGPSGEDHLQDAVQKTRRGISRLIDSYQDGLLEKPEFEPRVRAARERLTRLEEAVRAQLTEDQQRRTLRLVIGRLNDFADTVKGGLHDADWTTRREIIRAVVKQIEIDENDVRILYKIAPDGATPGVSQGSLQHRRRRESPDLPIMRGAALLNVSIRSLAVVRRRGQRARRRGVHGAFR